MNNKPTGQVSDSSTPASRQFGLSKVFYLMAVYAAGLPFGAWTIVLTTLVLGGWWILLGIKNGKGLIALILLAIAFAIGLLMPSVQQVREAHRLTQLLNTVRQITLTIINMEGRKGVFPPAYLTDDEGRPIHSWRVLILPNFEQQELYDKYDFSEPWDGPNNIKLLDQMPPSFSCDKSNFENGLTSFKLIVDKGGPFEGGKEIGYVDITDGASSTFAVVEDLANPVPWTKPEDLTIEQAVTLLSSKRVADISRMRIGSFNSTFYGPAVSLLDGSTHFVGWENDPDVIQNFCTRNDRQIVNIEMLGGPVSMVRWDRYVALILYVVLLMLPGMIASKRKIAYRKR